VRETVARAPQVKKALALCLALISTTAALSGCGGSGSVSSPTAPAQADAAAMGRPTAVQTEAICARATDEAQSAAANLPNAMATASTPEEAITNTLVRPAIHILEKEAVALAALHSRSNSPVFSTFVGLFEPVLVLARQRLASGRAASTDESHQLEYLTTTLTGEQVRLANSLGLPRCETDFFKALGTTR
jgi:hypothetical protein